MTCIGHPQVQFGKIKWVNKMSKFNLGNFNFRKTFLVILYIMASKTRSQRRARTMGSKRTRQIKRSLGKAMTQKRTLQHSLQKAQQRQRQLQRSLQKARQ
jgi:hypothetical protein